MKRFWAHRFYRKSPGDNGISSARGENIMKGFIKKSTLIAGFGLIGVLTVWITWTGFDMNSTGETEPYGYTSLGCGK